MPDGPRRTSRSPSRSTVVASSTSVTYSVSKGALGQKARVQASTPTESDEPASSKVLPQPLQSARTSSRPSSAKRRVNGPGGGLTGADPVLCSDSRRQAAPFTSPIGPVTESSQPRDDNAIATASTAVIVLNTISPAC